MERDHNIDSEKSWAYSPKHTRLRYQTFISALTFASVIAFDVQEVALPMGLVTFENNSSVAEQQLIQTLFGLFFVFSIVSFFVRTRIERNFESGSERALIAKMVEFKSLVSDLKKDIFAEIDAPYDQLKVGIESASAQLENANDPNQNFAILKAIKSIPEDLNALTEHTNELIEIQKEIRSALEASRVGFKPNEGPVVDNEAWHNLMQRYKAFMSKWPQFMRQLHTANITPDLMRFVEKQSREVPEIMKGAVQMANNYEQKRLEILSDYVAKFETPFQKLETSISDFHSVLNAKRRDEYVERELLGFWAPLLFSLLVVAFSLYIRLCG